MIRLDGSQGVWSVWDREKSRRTMDVWDEGPFNEWSVMYRLRSRKYGNEFIRKEPGEETYGRFD